MGGLIAGSQAGQRSSSRAPYSSLPPPRDSASAYPSSRRTSGWPRVDARCGESRLSGAWPGLPRSGARDVAPRPLSGLSPGQPVRARRAPCPAATGWDVAGLAALRRAQPAHRSGGTSPGWATRCGASRGKLRSSAQADRLRAQGVAALQANDPGAAGRASARPMPPRPVRQGLFLLGRLAQAEGRTPMPRT